MAPFCLIPRHIDAFLEKIRNGELDAEKLSKMTSAERSATFAEFLGETNAAHVNAAFESKLLLRNQKAGIENWIKQTTEGKPAIQRDLLARVQRMEKVLEPADHQAFLADLAHQKLGFGVSMEEAGRISELAKATTDAKRSGDWSAFGQHQVAFENYVADLKASGPKPLTVGQAIENVAGFTKSIKAAWDDSAPFRQGWKTIFSNPVEWQKNTRQTFVDMWKTLGGEAVMNNLRADVYSRPNYRNGNYQKAKLALWNAEETFPTSLPEKIPVLGRVYKASENAFRGFQYRMRVDLFDKYAAIAQKAGVDLNDRTEIESLGKMVNSLTSRGHLGKAEPAADIINVVAFSGRKFKSDLDFLTAHQGQKGVTPFVRKQAAMNLAKTVAGTAAVLLIADAVAPGSVEWNPESSDFGQIRVGNTRFDMTGGMRSLAVLSARLAMGATKSTTTGKVTPLNSGKYGAKTRGDVLLEFARAKASPVAGLVATHLAGKDFKGDSPTFLGDLSDLIEPLPSSTARELLSTKDSAPLAIGVLADMLGVSVNSYEPKKHRGVDRPYFSMPK